MTKAPPPSPLALLGAVVYGMIMGFLPGFFIFLAVNTSIPAALAILAVIMVLAIAQHMIGWALVMVPWHALNWLWRLATGQPAAPEPGEPEATPGSPVHWTLKAGFLSGFVLMILLLLHGALGMSEGSA